MRVSRYGLGLAAWIWVIWPGERAADGACPDAGLRKRWRVVAVPGGRRTECQYPCLCFGAMDARELALRSRDFDGWLGPALAGLLIGRGYLDEVRLQAGQGDWTCALRLAEELNRLGKRDSALRVLAPFADCGWWNAVDAVAGFLDEWERTSEAVSLVSPHAAAGKRLAVRRLARLLARQGRADDVIALLGPRVHDWYLARALVELTDGRARDDEVLSLLPVAGPVGIGGEPHNALELRARVLERQGRADEAMMILLAGIEAGKALNTGHVEQLAGMMVRHGRLAELRELVTGRGGVHAAYSLFASHAGQGAIDEAIRVLRPFIADGNPNAACRAARLLAAHGRAGEAIEILKPVPALIQDPEWLVHVLLELLSSQGRAEEAVSYVDDLAAQFGGMTEELFRLRVRAQADSGQREQAIAALRAHPQADAWYMRDDLARLLAEGGRAEEAIDVLRQPADARRRSVYLAELLIQAGRVKEAVAVRQVRRSGP